MQWDLLNLISDDNINCDHIKCLSLYPMKNIDEKSYSIKIFFYKSEEPLQMNCAYHT